MDHLRHLALLGALAVGGLLALGGDARAQNPYGPTTIGTTSAPPGTGTTTTTTGGGTTTTTTGGTTTGGGTTTPDDGTTDAGGSFLDHLREALAWLLGEMFADAPQDDVDFLADLLVGMFIEDLFSSLFHHGHRSGFFDFD